MRHLGMALRSAGLGSELRGVVPADTAAEDVLGELEILGRDPVDTHRATP